MTPILPASRQVRNALSLPNVEPHASLASDSSYGEVSHKYWNAPGLVSFSNEMECFRGVSGPMLHNTRRLIDDGTSFYYHFSLASRTRSAVTSTEDSVSIDCGNDMRSPPAISGI